MRLPLKLSCVVATGVACFAISNSARAQQNIYNAPPQQQAPPPAQTTVVQPAPAPVAREGGSEWAGPNRHLLVSGIVVFGASYGAAAVVAGASEHRGDDNLYAPLVGPWIDLADRGHCGPGCDDTGNRVLLVFDGVLQAVGAISIISAFEIGRAHV